MRIRFQGLKISPLAEVKWCGGWDFSTRLWVNISCLNRAFLLLDMKKTARPLGEEAILSVNRRLETLELESYMQSFPEFMESPVKIEDPNEIKHHMGSVIRRWKRLNDDDKFRTFGYALGMAKFLSLNTSADFRKALREFSILVYETR